MRCATDSTESPSTGGTSNTVGGTVRRRAERDSETQRDQHFAGWGDIGNSIFEITSAPMRRATKREQHAAGVRIKAAQI